MDEKDKLYETSPQNVADFVFDERVVQVFPDMIRRSVPGYGLVLQMIGLIAGRYVQQDSRVYDLGCSLGAATQVMREAVSLPGVSFVAVDNSPDMIERCRQRMVPGDGLSPVELIHADICQIGIENASMTVLNFTLQFIEPAQRMALLERIATGTRDGGVLLLSEKIRFSDAKEQDVQTCLHHDFKQAQGYSALEIAAKRNALERVLLPDTELEHQQRLRAAGWRRTARCFQAFNFVTYLAFR